MNRLYIKSHDTAQKTMEGLYKDLERRIIASPPGQCPVDLTASFLRLCHSQSCGKCVPCRVGLGQLQHIIDDIVDTAGTLIAGIDLLYKQGAKEVYACCTHGVLSGPAIERLKNSNIVEFVCTNTIPQAEKKAQLEKMTVLSVGKLLGLIIKGMEENRSVSEVLQSYNS